MKNFLRGGMAQELNVAVPGFVLRYDKTRRIAKVKIAISFEDEGCPEIDEVPVQFPAGGGCAILFPLVKGDPVLLIFSHSSIEEWLSSSGKEEVTPADLRSFDLTDAFAIPGVTPPAAIKEPKLRIEFTEDGAIELGGKAVKALVNETFLSLYNAHTHTAPGGTTGVPLVLSTAAHKTTKVKGE